MELNIELEKPSSILRKLKIKVPASVVNSHFNKGLVEVQKTARLKGFRPGNAPISVIKQFYGEDVRHRVYHSLIDESFRKAVAEHQLKTIGSPKIESPEHKTGEGEHDHGISENKDFSYVATVEVMPELHAKGFTGISLMKEKVSVSDEDVDKMVDNLRNSQAEFKPYEAGVRKLQKGDYADIAFSGGLVTEHGIEEKPGMKGSRMLEVGSNSLIPGFEEEMIGMKSAETKTFRIKFPKDYHEKDFASKEAEFTVTVNEVKEKILPTLDDEFVKQMGYENVEDLRKKVREHLIQDRTDEVDRKLRSDLLQTLIDKNSFEVPQTLVDSQTRALVQDWVQELKRYGYDDATIQNNVMQELGSVKKKAENQVRASLILESIAEQEKIAISNDELEQEVERLAVNMKVESQKLRDYYSKDPSRKEDLLFRMRQERTVKHLLEKVKIKEK